MENKGCKRKIPGEIHTLGKCRSGFPRAGDRDSFRNRAKPGKSVKVQLDWSWKEAANEAAKGTVQLWKGSGSKCTSDLRTQCCILCLCVTLICTCAHLRRTKQVTYWYGREV